MYEVTIHLHSSISPDSDAGDRSLKSSVTSYTTCMLVCSHFISTSHPSMRCILTFCLLTVLCLNLLQFMRHTVHSQHSVSVVKGKRKQSAVSEYYSIIITERVLCAVWMCHCEHCASTHYNMHYIMYMYDTQDSGLRIGMTLSISSPRVCTRVCIFLLLMRLTRFRCTHVYVFIVVPANSLSGNKKVEEEVSAELLDYKVARHTEKRIQNREQRITRRSSPSRTAYSVCFIIINAYAL